MKVELSTPDITPLGWRARRRARRRLAELDALGARLAELSRIRDLVEAAGTSSRRAGSKTRGTSDPTRGASTS